MAMWVSTPDLPDGHDSPCSLLALGAAVFALIHAVRQRKDAFTAVDKLSKPIWLGILAVATLVLLILPVVGLFGIVAVVAVCVYLVDVRPAGRRDPARAAVVVRSRVAASCARVCATEGSPDVRFRTCGGP